ncbi:UNVERIFIED_CONTAM: hypothetical protein FKN15_011552 [Acipenser sinensis]
MTDVPTQQEPAATASPPSSNTASLHHDHAPPGPKPKLPCFSDQASLEAFLAQFELAATEHVWWHFGDPTGVLLRALKRRFGESEPYLLLQDQLQNRRQIHGERLGVLGTAINRLPRRAYCSEDNSFIRRIALDAFLRSIEPPELRYQVHLAAPATLDEAIDRSTTIKAIFLDQPAAHSPTSRPISWTQSDMDRERESLTLPRFDQRATGRDMIRKGSAGGVGPRGTS